MEGCPLEENPPKLRRKPNFVRDMRSAVKRYADVEGFNIDLARWEEEKRLHQEAMKRRYAIQKQASNRSRQRSAACRLQAGQDERQEKLIFVQAAAGEAASNTRQLPLVTAEHLDPISSHTTCTSTTAVTAQAICVVATACTTAIPALEEAARGEAFTHFDAHSDVCVAAIHKQRIGAGEPAVEPAVEPAGEPAEEEAREEGRREATEEAGEEDVEAGHVGCGHVHFVRATHLEDTVAAHTRSKCPQGPMLEAGGKGRSQRVRTPHGLIYLDDVGLGEDFSKPPLPDATLQHYLAILKGK